MDERRYLRIFLSERLVLVRGGRDLAVRVRNMTDDPARLALIGEVVAEFDRGCATLTSFLRQVGTGRPHVRLWLVAGAVRVGGFKLNGRVTGRSPLSDLEEFDALTTVLRCAASVWSALDRAEVAASDVVRGHAEVCETLANQLEPLRLASAERALRYRR